MAHGTEKQPPNPLLAGTVGPHSLKLKWLLALSRDFVEAPFLPAPLPSVAGRRQVARKSSIGRDSLAAVAAAAAIVESFKGSP